VKLKLSVYMNTRPVTRFATAVSVKQPPRTLYKEFEVTFAGWYDIEEGASWDIFGTYDPTDPRTEVLIRNGVVPADRERYVSVDGNGVPSLTVKGFSRIWLALRRAPVDTLVLVPGAGLGNTVEAALEAFAYRSYRVVGARVVGARGLGVTGRRSVGRYRVLQHVSTMHRAVERLAREAGFRAEVRLPDYELAPLVLDPTKSYWAAISDLVAPFAPETWYRESTNTVVIADPLAPRFEVGSKIELAAGVVSGVRGVPVRRRRVRRVIVSVPPCR
jgi:hypothetical protein